MKKQYSKDHPTKKNSPKNALSDDPIQTTVSILQGKWTLLILRHLMSGKKRFGQLGKSVGGINAKTLSLRLKELEGAGVLNREFFPEVPPRVEYALTAKGLELGDLMGAMEKWGVRWKDENAALAKERAEEKRPPARRNDILFID